jgi:hypothetical protein
MINDNKPFPVVIRGLLNYLPSGLRGVTNKVNPSGTSSPASPPTSPNPPANPPADYFYVQAQDYTRDKDYMK